MSDGSERRDVAEALGRLYEVAFNTGVLTTLAHTDGSDGTVDAYREDMGRWRLGSAIARISRNAGVVDLGFARVVRNAAEYLYTKGYVTGLLFTEEFLSRIKTSRSSRVEVMYFGCDFDGENNFGQWMGQARRTSKEVLLERLIGREFQDWEIGRWKGEGSKGEFLQADCLLLLKIGTRRPRYHILSVDFSAFSGGSLLNSDISGIEAQRLALSRELHALRSKSVFSGLYLDTGRPGSDSSKRLTADTLIPSGLKDYMGAFKYRDKEVVKLVQAGAYAHSFYEMLLEEDHFPDGADVRFTAIGNTDRDSVSISVSEREREILKTCHDIYKNHDTKRQMPAKRQDVLDLIAKNASSAFENGEGFVRSILDLPQSALGSAPGVGRVVRHDERLSGFLSPLEAPDTGLLNDLDLGAHTPLRAAHSSLIRRELGKESDSLYVFLTGSPGIGKTTSLVNYLADHEDEGFLFIYVSPRKHVNRDIVTKFAEKDFPDDLLCINSNREIVDEGDSGPTVEFQAGGTLRDRLLAEQKIGGVRFLDADRPGVQSSGGSDKTERENTGTITDNEHSGVGVLYSVFSAMNAAIENNLSNRVVATAAVQALKQTGSGDTLKHVPEIFSSVLNDGEPIQARMRELSERVKNVFVMVDEITGDPAGAEFLSKLGKQLETLGLTDEQYGFNTKIIVADASIVDRDVIEQHLSEASSEPDKIFFRSAATDGKRPLSVETFRYKNRYPSVIVNANCYPAAALNLSFRLRCEALRFEGGASQNQRELAKSTLGSIENDILAVLLEPDKHPGQTIVYIQDKARLAQLIEQVQLRLASMEGSGLTLGKPDDYIEIHAKLSYREERMVEQYKDRARVVFMTSSASQGLSFKNARRIIVEIPRFSLEQNLMELIQVIYRGRGLDSVDREEKQVVFYVSESVYYDAGSDDERRDDALRDGTLNLLTFLLVLKTSLMTRIYGSGRIGSGEFLMVPVGGKNVSFAGQSYSGEINDFLRALSSQIRREPAPGHSLQRDVYEPIENLFKSSIYGIYNSPWVRAAEVFRSAFVDRASRGLSHLLDHPPLEDVRSSGASAVGSLLVVPYTSEDGMDEEYALRFAQKMGYESVKKLRDRLVAMSNDDDYPKDLKYLCRVPLDVLQKLLDEMSGKSQRFKQNTSRPDRYYALPISLYIFGAQLKEHFDLVNTGANQYLKEHEREHLAFRNLMESYLRAHFPLDGVLPVGAEYGEYPFLIFNSYNLKELRGKLFAENQMLASNELNVLNLILTNGN